MGHRHLVEAGGDGGSSRLTNTIYIEGVLAPLWRLVSARGRRSRFPNRSA